LGVGDRIGSYRLQERLGSGGMGSVWIAANSAGTQVAVKVMHPHLRDDADLVARFKREYDIGRTVRHVGLISMIEYGDDGRTPFIAMELAPGKSLRRLIERGGPFAERDVATIGRGVAEALDALHAHRIVHRDLKSSNVVVSRELETKVVDFGIARYIDTDDSSTWSGFAGSPEYSAPDAYFGKPPTAHSDVYSLGIVLYEALTGEVPFRAGHYADVLRMHAEQPVPDVRRLAPAVSAPMERLIRSMLDKSPAARPDAAMVAASCTRIGAALRAPAPARVRPAPSPQRGSATSSNAPRRQRAIGLGIVVAVALLGIAAVAAAVIVAAAGSA